MDQSHPSLTDRRTATTPASQGPSSVSSSFGSYADMRRLLRQMLPSVARAYRAQFDASDIVQQTLLEACAKSQDFRGRSEKEFAGWLQQILQHNLLDAVRRLRSRKRDIARERRIQNATDSYSGSNLQLAADQTSPSAHFAAAEEFQRVREAIQRLPDTQRKAVALHHLDGLTLREIAARMSCSRGAVAGLLHRGLKNLQAELRKMP